MTTNKKAEARERVKAMREEQARKDRRRDQLMKFGIVGAIVIAVAIIAVAVVQTRGGADVDPEAQPAGVSEPGGGVLAAEAGAEAPTVEVWFDFSCPHCATFEAANGDFLNGLADSGEANLVYRPVTFVGLVQSERASNAWACSLDEGMGEEYMDAIYAIQPNYTNNQLLNAASGVGLDSSEFRSCVNNGAYDGWVKASHDAGTRDHGVSGTPTIYVVSGDERTLVERDAWTPEGLHAAVLAASGSADE